MTRLLSAAIWHRTSWSKHMCVSQMERPHAQILCVGFVMFVLSVLHCASYSCIDPSNPIRLICSGQSSWANRLRGAPGVFTWQRHLLLRDSLWTIRGGETCGTPCCFERGYKYIRASFLKVRLPAVHPSRFISLTAVTNFIGSCWICSLYGTKQTPEYFSWRTERVLADGNTDTLYSGASLCEFRSGHRHNWGFCFGVVTAFRQTAG